MQDAPEYQGRIDVHRPLFVIYAALFAVCTALFGIFIRLSNTFGVESYDALSS